MLQYPHSRLLFFSVLGLWSLLHGQHFLRQGEVLALEQGHRDARRSKSGNQCLAAAKLIPVVPEDVINRMMAAEMNLHLAIGQVKTSPQALPTGATATA